jgi:hypothetical protein
VIALGNELGLVYQPVKSTTEAVANFAANAAIRTTIAPALIQELASDAAQAYSLPIRLSRVRQRIKQGGHSLTDINQPVVIQDRTRKIYCSEKARGGGGGNNGSQAKPDAAEVVL